MVAYVQGGTRVRTHLSTKFRTLLCFYLFFLPSSHLLESSESSESPAFLLALFSLQARILDILGLDVSDEGA